MRPLLTKRSWTVCLFDFVFCLFVSSSAASNAREHFKYQVQELFGDNNIQRLAAGGRTTCSCLTPEKKKIASSESPAVNCEFKSDLNADEY